MIKAKTLVRGQQAEKSFKHVYAFALFGLAGLLMYDETERFREGEYRLPDGSIVELKGDWRCYHQEKASGNLPIENYHSGHTHGYGWFQHCSENHIDYIVFACFRSEKKRLPYRVICISFPDLKHLIDTHGQSYPYRKIRDGNDTIGFYCVPVKELIEKCGAKVIETKAPHAMSAFVEALNAEAQYALEAMEIDGQLGEVIMNECIHDTL